MVKSNSFLIDTHVLIWFLANRLKSKVRELIQNPENLVFVSAASVWEIVIKKARGKITTPPHMKQAIEAAGFPILPIEIDHVLGIEDLPHYHEDPFDRMLISQAIVEKLTVITDDSTFSKYPVSVWS